MAYWKINCMERDYPGLWQTWFLQQTAAIGWPPPTDTLLGETKNSSWAAARKAALKIRPGDKLIVQLSDSRVGRVGTVSQVKISDKEWLPTVPEDAEHPRGEMGRRIDVRWDLTVGTVSPSAVMKLPEAVRFKGRVLRSTIVRLQDELAEQIVDAMTDELNWTAIHPRFASERAISEYINSFPHLLEDGLRPYPSIKTREFTFSDNKRSDVLLLDPQNQLVIVECKQGAPSVENIEQLRHYMKRARIEILGPGINKSIRGILVHGGPRRVDQRVLKSADTKPFIELVRYAVDVDFATSR